jgi:hypothetical protein
MKKQADTMPRRKKVRVDFPSLSPALVDKKLVAKVKAKVLFERIVWDEEQQVRLHEGTIFSYDPEDGYVCVWDETRQQFFAFMETDPVNIRVRNKEDLLPEAELVVVKEELKMSKLHIKILEEKLGKLYLPIRS